MRIDIKPEFDSLFEARHLQNIIETMESVVEHVMESDAWDSTRKGNMCGALAVLIALLKSVPQDASPEDF